MSSRSQRFNSNQKSHMGKMVSKIQFPVVLGLVLGEVISQQLMNVFGLLNWKYSDSFVPGYVWIWWQTVIYVFVYFSIALCLISFIKIVRMSKHE